MRERGTVHALSEGAIMIEVTPVDETVCAGCGMGKKCLDGVPHVIRVPYRGDVRVGDDVELDIPVPSAAASSLVLFISPLVGLLAGYGLGAAAYAFLERARTPLLVAGTLVGLVAGLGVVLVVERRWRTRHPTTVTILRDD